MNLTQGNAFLVFSVRATPFNKRHEMSPLPSCSLHQQLWQDVQTMKAIKCPPNSSFQRGKNSKPKEQPPQTLILTLKNYV